MYFVVRKVFNIVNFFIPLLLAVMGILASFYSKNEAERYFSQHPNRGVIFEFLINNSGSIIVLIFFVWLVVFVLKFIVVDLASKEKKELIKFILNQYQKEAFDKGVASGVAQDHNRVTLFKFKRRHVRIVNSHWLANKGFFSFIKRFWPASYLVFYLRSGHQSQKTNVIFPVFDESDRSSSYAAYIWSVQDAGFVEGLPDLINDPTEQNIADYSEYTCTEEETIRSYIAKQRAMPCSIAAIPLAVKGRPWGVLVLDSRWPNGVNGKSISNFRVTVASIERILELKL